MNLYKMTDITSFLNKFDFIEKVIYINLEHRKDRNEQLLETMKELNVPSEKIQRINAIHNNIGALGCTKSHILTLETFLQSDHKVCLVVEDDFTYKNKDKSVKFLNSAKNVIRKYFIGDEL